MCYAKQLKSLMEFQELQALKTLAEHKNSADQAAIVIEGAAVTSTNTEVSGKVRTRLTYNCAHLRSTKEKKEENIWRRKIFFAEGTINGGGKGG